ncbi:MAG TPA: hypothetical protein VEV84_12670 [Pyrinomonadaceae bacterium]|jgi:hypothetical protein|nr:hypothetical protein [Pyrinomonadaceae bacterium]
MNRNTLFASFVLTLAFCLGAYGQASPAPPGAGDRNTGDTNIKERSVELERVDRDMHKNQKSAEPTPKVNFDQIKEDFEQIQVAFDKGIVQTYRTSNPMNYAKIADSATELKDRATRLRSNLFPDAAKKNKEKKDTAEYVPVSGAPADVVKNLIVNLNGSLGAFVASPIFQSTKVVDPKDSEAAKANLDAIIAQSNQLSIEAGKMK